MKTCFKNCWRLPFSIVLGVCLACSLRAQTFKTLHSFSPVLGQTTNGWDTNAEGEYPAGVLTLFGSSLYGTAYFGGQWGSGTIFKLNVDGTGFQVMHEFSAMATNSLQRFTNIDGYFPESRLVLHSNELYGTIVAGGPFGDGTLFSLEMNGGFQVLHSFSGPDGWAPVGDLIVEGTRFYGATSDGGSNGFGTVFSVSDDGSNLQMLFQFDSHYAFYFYAFSGIYPSGGLTLSGTTLYGTTSTSWSYCCSPGGSFSYGTIYALNTTGQLLWYSDVDLQGAGPEPGLVLLGTNLYGTAFGVWGTPVTGSIFSIDTTGTNLHVIHTLAPATGANASWPGTNSDGINPIGLVLSGNTLYGVTTFGGTNGYGTVFSLLIDGSMFKVLHTFSGGQDGRAPKAGLTLSGNTLYGTTAIGGDNDIGTIFSISLPVPQLAINNSSEGIILTWPADSGGFTLQSTTNLLSPVWTTNSPAPVVVNGQNTVTNPISATQQFYRLEQ
jgi:uncharacterized repeat protein (TIGR03803 family)